MGLSVECPLGIAVGIPRVRDPIEDKMEPVFYDLPLEVTLCHYFCLLCIRRESLIPTILKGVGIEPQLTREENHSICGLILKPPQQGTHSPSILWGSAIIQGLDLLASSRAKIKAWRRHTSFLKTLIQKWYISHPFSFQWRVSHIASILILVASITLDSRGGWKMQFLAKPSIS